MSYWEKSDEHNSPLSGEMSRHINSATLSKRNLVPYLYTNVSPTDNQVDGRNTFRLQYPN